MKMRTTILARTTVGLAVVGLVVGAWAQTPTGAAAWNWVSAFWRLDVGAPADTAAYPDDIGHPALRLAVAGDVGTGGGPERATAAVIDDLETQQEFDALLLLGDDVYPAGDPARVQQSVFEPFAGVLDGGTELVAALGNHDVQEDEGTPLLEALGMPGRWYERLLGPARIVVVDSTRASDPGQLAWLRRVLAAPTSATWTIVIQHHPPFSAGYHGSHGPSDRFLVPLYEQFGVDLVLAGHDHDYQRIVPQHGVTYVVTGAAAKLRPTARASFTAVAASTYSFVELDVDADRLAGRAIDHDGRVFDSFVLRSRPG